ncbi:hypothetical protein EE612_017529 [Oryza sativa]|nr:hypothetical protein EE612_017529 [Oryza sativa]
MEEVLLRHARLPRPTAPTARRSRRLRVVAVALRTRPTSLAVPGFPPAPAPAPSTCCRRRPWPRAPPRCCSPRGCRPPTSGGPRGCAPSCCPCPWGPSRRRCGS